MKLRQILFAIGFFAAGASFATWWRGEPDPPPHHADRATIAQPAPAPRDRPVHADAPTTVRDHDAPRRRAPVESAPATIRLGDPSSYRSPATAYDADVDVGLAPSPAKAVHARFLLAGRPVAGIEINGARSDAEGRITFSLPRSYRGFVVVAQPDGVQLNLSPAQDDAESFDFGDVRVQPAGTIEGRVVDEVGKPLAAATVELLSSDLDCRTVSVAATDAQGRFTLTGVGPYRYEVAMRGAVGARVAGVRAGASDLRLVARTMFPVTLRLVDDATGAPISGPWIACELRRPGAPADESFHELRHEGSSVKLALDAPGTYEIDVRLGGPAGRFTRRVPAVELEAGRENVVDVRLVKD